VPNPNLTIRNFCIAVAQGAEQLRAGKAEAEAAADAAAAEVEVKSSA
jgi:hypothetical protein